jgi:hypothetical protein
VNLKNDLVRKKSNLITFEFVFWKFCRFSKFVTKEMHILIDLASKFRLILRNLSRPSFGGAVALDSSF